jgi:nucleotide-binding universal stress UspA family protein
MGGFAHILIATDLTDRSERALERAARLGRDGLAERFTLLHVVAAGLPQILATQQQNAAEILLAGKIAHLPSVGVPTPASAIVRTGEVFSTIIGEAISGKADLVIVGAPSKSPYVQTIVGTTAERVIRFVERPVLLVNQPTHGPYARVLVAFDGSDGAVRGLAAALVLAPDAEFRIVHAWWPPRVSLGDSDEARCIIDEDNKRLRAMVQAAAKEGAATSQPAPPRLSVDMVEDNPYLVVSNELRWPDLLVMGTHSKGRLASTVSIGRLALHLLNEATCDVLTSRP